MAYFFDVYGSFPITRIDGEVVRNQRDLWDEAEDRDEGLSTAIGCYMFCLVNGESIKPWYVGMTMNKDGFRAEAFEWHKHKVYNEIVSENKGHPRLFLFPLLTGDGGVNSRFSKNRSDAGKSILWLEKTLMGMALQRNPDLWNIKDCTLPRSVTVRGILGERSRGPVHKEVAEARRALFG